MNVLELAGAVGEEAGGKAAPLAQLIRAGFNVPQGFVIPTYVYRRVAAENDLPVSCLVDAAEIRDRILNFRLPEEVVQDISRALEELTRKASTNYVAVRSSSTAEDAASTSAAGQHDSVLAVRGTEQVCRAILTCWASLWSDRATAYRTHSSFHQDELDMAVVVQRFIDADVAGIMFTGDTCVIEASWGIGTDIVAGQFTPDFWRIRGSTIGDFRLGDQMKRTDRHGTQLVTRLVDLNERHQPCLTETQVLDLHALGQAVSRTLGGPRDIEWAIAGDTFWILQARPVTVPVPSSAPQRSPTVGGKTLSGVPASPGTASGPVRLIRGHADFATVQGGDVIVCRTTDPAWTPLFMRAAAVITETGGVLSHAAIVAREVGIPAVLAVPQATELLKPASMVTVDGTSGHATTINP